MNLEVVAVEEGVGHGGLSSPVVLLESSLC